MCLIAGGKQISRDVPFGRDIGHDLDFVFDLRKLGEEFGLGIALDDIAGNGAASLKGGFQTVGVRFIEEHLGLQNFGRITGNRGIIAKRQIEQHLNRRAAFHVGEKLKGKGWRNFRNNRLTKDDFFQEGSLHTSSTRGPRKRVVDQKIQ